MINTKFCSKPGMLFLAVVAWGLLFMSMSNTRAFAHAITVSPINSKAQAEQDVGLSILADLNQPVIAISMVIKYDPTVLSITDDRIKAGSACAGWSMYKDSSNPGTITVGLFNAASLPIASAQQIAFINFAVKKGTESKVSSIMVSKVVFNETSLTTQEITSGTVTVVAAPTNTPPQINTVGERQVNILDTLTFTIQATDADGDALIYVATGLPAGANFNGATRVFSWKPVSNQIGTYAVMFKVSDGKNTVSQSVTIKVTAAGKLLMTTTAGAGGSISPQGVTPITYGSSFKVLVRANPGFIIDAVKIDGVQYTAMSGNKKTGTYVFAKVTASKKVEATFKLEQYKVSVKAGAGGKINPSGNLQVEHGGSITVQLTADKGYQIKKLLVSGREVPVLNDGTATVTAIESDKNITASFAPIINTITTSAGIGGNVSPLGEIKVTYGGERKVYVWAKVGYKVDKVMVDGQKVVLSTDKSYTFKNVTTQHSLSATFMKI